MCNLLITSMKSRVEMVMDLNSGRVEYRINHYSHQASQSRLAQGIAKGLYSSA